jgi:hypothetical protein
MPRISRRPWLIAVALALTLSATALAAGIAEGAVIDDDSTSAAAEAFGHHAETLAGAIDSFRARLSTHERGT